MVERVRIFGLSIGEATSWPRMCSRTFMPQGITCSYLRKRRGDTEFFSQLLQSDTRHIGHFYGFLYELFRVFSSCHDAPPRPINGLF